jgi:hypothetical protein
MAIPYSGATRLGRTCHEALISEVTPGRSR